MTDDRHPTEDHRPNYSSSHANPDAPAQITVGQWTWLLGTVACLHDRLVGPEGAEVEDLGPVSDRLRGIADRLDEMVEETETESG